MVRRAAAVVQPAAAADAARRRGPLAQLEDVQRGAAERVRDPDPAPRAAEAQVATAVDGDGGLRAAGAFSGPIGPSWWGVRRG
jgi:hypothetical protein